jgi:radical SAM superfamily enzyme YgiQ (UPF0313 family)
LLAGVQALDATSHVMSERRRAEDARLGWGRWGALGCSVAPVARNVVESCGEGIARIHRHHITVQAGIVLGFDGDDASTFEATLQGATRAGLAGATVSILTPLPQTPIFEEFQRAGRLLTRDWSYDNGKTAVAFRLRGNESMSQRSFRHTTGDVTDAPW